MNYEKARMTFQDKIKLIRPPGSHHELTSGDGAVFSETCDPLIINFTI